MKLVRFFLIVVVFCLLTILTQVGGVLYLLSFFAFNYIGKKIDYAYLRYLLKFFAFSIIYFIGLFVIVPYLAKPFGRVPLPMFEENNLKPYTIMTCLLGRNYVRPALKEISLGVADKMNRKYPGTVVNYLDANFPFINNFPLFPHLSHDDGKKLDLSFCYIDVKLGKQTNENPSFIGYGVCEEPLIGEINTAKYCEEKGYWQYSLLGKIVSQKNKKLFEFDIKRSRDLVGFLASNESIGKIFIETHLKNRMKLPFNKIKFHGCQAVRHDDHIHVQLK